MWVSLSPEMPAPEFRGTPTSPSATGLAYYLYQVKAQSLQNGLEGPSYSVPIFPCSLSSCPNQFRIHDSSHRAKLKPAHQFMPCDFTPLGLHRFFQLQWCSPSKTQWEQDLLWEEPLDPCPSKEFIPHSLEVVPELPLTKH